MLDQKNLGECAEFNCDLMAAGHVVACFDLPHGARFLPAPRCEAHGREMLDYSPYHFEQWEWRPLRDDDAAALEAQAGL